jgi:hypothetical protein
MNVARLRSPVYALCLSILAVYAACGTADVPPKEKQTSNTDNTTGTGGDNSSGAAGTSSTTGTTTGSGGSTGTGGSTGGAAGTSATTGAGGGSAGTDVGMGGMAGMAPPLEPAIPLPVVIDTYYAASGFMGDGATPNTIVLGADCPMRAPGMIGKCSKFTYTPAAAGVGWGGVYWQAPANNWGDLAPGKHIEAGATKVTFYAAGAKGGEVVTFIAGGIMGTNYQDPPKMQLPNQVLTTTMTQYSIDLTGYNYVSIIGGFGWTIEAKALGDGGFDSTPITFYVDGIQWVK